MDSLKQIRKCGNGFLGMEASRVWGVAFQRNPRVSIARHQNDSFPAEDGNPSGREHGIRPHSLKVTTISALMAAVVKGYADISQIDIRGIYRAAAARDMATIYSRNVAQNRLFASKSPRFDSPQIRI